MTASAAKLSVWLCRTDRWTGSAAEATCLPWLASDERVRWDSFLFPSDKHLYLVAHGLVRAALSRLFPELTPGEWQFERDKMGRPHIANRVTAQKIQPRFSLTHTRGLAAVAIAVEGDIGIDAEAAKQPDDPALAAALTVFTEAEQRWATQAKIPSERRILRLWTLKEAVAKACGLGLALPLDSYDFALHPHRGIMRLGRPVDDKAGRWHFLEAAPPGWRLSLAFRKGKAEPLDRIPIHLAEDQDFSPSRSIAVTLLQC